MRYVILGAINVFILSHFENALMYWNRSIVEEKVSQERLISCWDMRIMLWKCSKLSSFLNARVSRSDWIDKNSRGLSYLRLVTTRYGKLQKSLNTDSLIRDTLKFCLKFIQSHQDRFFTYLIHWVKPSTEQLSKYTYPLDTKLPVWYFALPLHRLLSKGLIYLIPPIYM